jgi:hypothetical protein
MIEVEHDDVGFTAIDARMCPKVLAYQRPILIAIATDPSDLLTDVRFAITDVVLAPIFRVARAATSLPSSFRLVMKSEIVDRLHEPAVVATLRLDRV